MGLITLMVIIGAAVVGVTVTVTLVSIAPNIASRTNRELRTTRVVVPHADSIVAGYIRQWNCMIEFGLDHVHDAYECENTMYLMNANSEYDYYAEAYNRELEEDMLGRPLFPNEY